VQVSAYPSLVSQSVGYEQVADAPGRFIAHSNIGIAHQALGDAAAAAEEHEAALRCAVQMSSLAGESLACAHLGTVKASDDAPTAKACTERRLLLSRTLGDAVGKADAYLQLGLIAQEAREWAEAREAFEHAMREAELSGDQRVRELARCSVGIAEGSLRFEGMLAAAAEGAGREGDVA